MRLNIALMRKVLGLIEDADYVGWHQSLWRCQTGTCFAGWVAIAEGAEWVTDDPRDAQLYTSVYPPGVEHRLENAVRVFEYAAKALGFRPIRDTGQFPILFDGGNSLARLEYYIDQFEKDQELDRTPDELTYSLRTLFETAIIDTRSLSRRQEELINA